MAVYKVPQDVEADDKLIGPFSFKQFVYLMIATLAIGLAYLLYQIIAPLAIIPLPIAIFFSVLALPLRKDQPFEVYLAAIISFITKPKVRVWQPDGVESLIEVIVPKSSDDRLGKNYSSTEVHRRLSYLADIADSGGWSIRGVSNQNNSMHDDFYTEAQTANDLLDETGDRARQINQMLDRANSEKRQQLITSIQQPGGLDPQITQATSISYATPEYTPTDPYGSMMSPAYTPMSTVQPAHPDEDVRLVINPYPTINQSIITPLNDHQPQTPPVNIQPVVDSVNDPHVNQPTVQPEITTPEPGPVQTTSEEPISPAIIDLANNHKDLSVETLSREANRIKQKELKLKEDEEVFISLR